LKEENEEEDGDNEKGSKNSPRENYKKIKEIILSSASY